MKKSQKSLKDWTDQEWTTKSGKPSTQGPKATGERYLPKKAIQAMSDSEYAASSRKKREDTKKGKQFSKQPKKAAKTARRFRNKGGIMNEQSSMLVPPERQPYVGGALVKTLLKLIRPLTKEQQATRAASAAQASVIKDKAAVGAGSAVVAGGIGYNLSSPEGERLIEAANAGEIEVEIKSIDQRINPKDFPTYAKDSDSARAFQEAFRNAREARADTFEFEGRTYLADLPVNREAKAEGGKFDKVMKEFSEGELKSSSGDKVTNRNQALAIAYASSRAKKQMGGLMEAARNVRPMLRKAEGGETKFPDLTGDGKVTQADILHGRGVFQEGGEVPKDTYPNIPPDQMSAVMASQASDEDMEIGYLNFIITETLSDSEQTYLKNALAADPQLSSILDKVLLTAAEFSGAGEVDGPGTGGSDSIPARLSDGEFVMTKKATDQIGAENLQRMMDDAERAFDGGMMSGQDLRKTSMSDDDVIQQQMAGSSKMPSIR